MAFGDSLPAAHRKFLGSDSAEDSRLLVLVPNIGCELPVISDLFPNHDILPDHFLRLRGASPIANLSSKKAHDALDHVVPNKWLMIDLHQLTMACRN